MSTHPLLRVYIGFATASDHVVEETAGAVIDGLYSATAAAGDYPTPPFGLLEFQSALNSFTAAIAARAQGGTRATAEKNERRAELVAMLRELAGYVQGACKNDLATLLSSGFRAVSNNRSRSQLATPGIRSIHNGNSGQLVLRVTAITNARCYEVRYSTRDAQPPVWQSGGIFTNSRSMPVDGLTPGTAYTFEVRAVGGATGYSGWSDAVGHMSM